MHIAVDTHCILPGQVGGIEQYTLGLLQRLAGAGSPAERVLVLTRPENHNLFSTFAADNVAVVCQVRTKLDWDDPKSAAALKQFQDQKRRILREHRVDVVHFPGNTINPIDLQLPVVLNLHDLQHRHYPQYFSKQELAHRERWWTASARRADALIAASHYVADDLRLELGIDAGRIIVTPDPVREEFLQPPTDAELASVRAKFGLNGPFFLYPAAAWPHKNHRRLIEAFAQVTQSGVQLVLTGAGQTSPELHDAISRLGQNTRVRLLGRVDTLTLRCLYKLAAALVMPSEHESVSIPIFEAMASGCPIACSNVTALPEQVADAAILFAPHDVAAMAAAMKSLLGDATLRDTLAERGSRRLSHFDSASATAALGAAYAVATSQFKLSKAA